MHNFSWRPKSTLRKINESEKNAQYYYYYYYSFGFGKQRLDQTKKQAPFSIDTGSVELVKKFSPENCSWEQQECNKTEKQSKQEGREE